MSMTASEMGKKRWENVSKEARKIHAQYAASKKWAKRRKNKGKQAQVLTKLEK